MPKNQITNGAFQDCEGNILNAGYLTLQLSHDEQDAASSGQVVGGVAVKVPLDSSGNISGTVNVWPNDVLLPAGSYYIVNAFRADGTNAWAAPQNWTIPSAPSPFNIGTIIPQNPPGPGIAGISALYRADGTAVTTGADQHITGGVAVLVAGAATVNLLGASAFSGATNYNVVTTAAHVATVTRVSGAQFTLAGTGTDSVTWFAIGQPAGS